MIVLALSLIALWFRPGWILMWALTLATGLICLAVSLWALSSAGALQHGSVADISSALLDDFLWNVGTFAAIGALIVVLRREALSKRAPAGPVHDG